INESLKRAIVDETVEVPPQYEEVKEEIINVIKKSIRKLPIGNHDGKVIIKPRKEVLLSPEFKDLWDRIKQKTTYRVAFDDERFVKRCLEEMEELRPRRSKINIDRVDIEIKRKGVEVDFKDTIKQDLQQRTYRLPDIIREIQDATMITRSTIIDILLKADKWELFKLNPHQFIEKT
ncbi:type III restriction endonuclease subunit R, partial [Bacillus altitudinis]